MVLPFGKPKCWKVFEENLRLLYSLGRDEFVNNTEEFVSIPLSGVTKCRCELFEKGSWSYRKVATSQCCYELVYLKKNEKIEDARPGLNIMNKKEDMFSDQNI